MPKIPGIGYQGGAPGPITSTRTVTPIQDKTGEALSRLGGVVADASFEMLQIYQQTEATAEATRAQKRLQDFSLALKYGSQDEEGNMLPPPPPDQHEELYRQEVEKIREESSGKLFGRASGIFDREFTPYANRQELVVKTAALDVYQSRISATTDENLAELANQFVSEHELVKPEIQAKASKLIDEKVLQGVFSPEEGLARKRKFIDDAHTGSFLKLESTDPEAAILAIDRGEFRDLPVDKQQRLRESAVLASERKDRKENAERERLEREQEKALRKTQDATAKEFWIKQSQGKLTPSMVIDNAANLSTDELKLLLKASKGEGTERSDPRTFEDLYRRAMDGEDVMGVTTQAALRGLIKDSDRNTIYGLVGSHSIVRQMGNRAKVWDEWLDKYMLPDAVNASDMEKYKAAEARTEYRQWLADHPKAEPKEIESEAKRIGLSYAAADRSSMLANMPTPKFHQGEKWDMDFAAVGAAYKRTKKAFEEKKISEREFNAQKKLLEKWARELSKPKISAPGAGEPK